MKQKEIEEMHNFEKTYWWHVGKKHLVLELVKKYKPNNSNMNILEIGCGTGEIAQSLNEFGKIYVNDISATALDYCKQKGIENVIEGDISIMNLTEYENYFDIVLALDVLEHIQDDEETIRKIYKLLKPNGLFIINVPAYKFLWSGHDEALQHKRRYTSYEITQKLKDAKFKIINKSHFVFFAFPVIATVKFLSNFLARRSLPRTSYIILPNKLNGFMINVLKMETKLLKNFDLPFGTTITVVAIK